MGIISKMLKKLISIQVIFVVAIIVATFGIIIDIYTFITDISSLNTDNLSKIALSLPFGLLEVVKQLANTIDKFPAVVFEPASLLWKYAVGYISGGIIMKILNYCLPPLSHGLGIISKAGKGKRITLHYKMFTYNSYSY